MYNSQVLFGWGMLRIYFMAWNQALVHCHSVAKGPQFCAFVYSGTVPKCPPGAPFMVHMRSLPRLVNNSVHMCMLLASS